jgi:hypothetical protein
MAQKKLSIYYAAPPKYTDDSGRLVDLAGTGKKSTEGK